jgi:sulfoxide reductase catalytic subunit YedY
VEKVASSEITPENLYLSRRTFLAAGGAAVASAALVSACRGPSPTPSAEGFCSDARSAATADELGAKLTTCENVTNYNNFYEFSLGKGGIAESAAGFTTSPWTVEVAGLVNKPRSYQVDELLKGFPPEERVYRLRCVEGWSMVIPWLGFPLANLLNEVEPRSQAKYVRFETIYDPEHMPGQRARNIEFPYVEGLRLDEAMNSLTILATGLYGKPLPVQDGAPIRLVVPWKYGFKSIKSIVKIELVEEMPVSAWMRESPQEYGFYANVNPDVDHPRWSQSSERRIGELTRRPTLLFNGYGKEVSGLYAGMDLAKFF